jgi:hypothetical protein
MATLEELLRDYGLADEAAQTKTASAKTESVSEVDEVLEGLGLSGADEGVTKVANEDNEQKKGDRMGLTDIYDNLFGEEPAEDGGVEKVASEEEGTEENEGSQLFGELTAHYFGQAEGQFMDKIAAMALMGGGVAGGGEGVRNQRTMALEVKQDYVPSKREKLDTHGEPALDSLREAAFKKQILKRREAAYAGVIEDQNIPKD